METNKIYNEDCLETMARMPEDFIDLTVTSPPYDNLRDYKGYSFDFESIAKELYRVTKEGGVVVWVVNDSTVDGSETLTSCKQKIYFREDCGFRIHDTMIYIHDPRFPQKNRYGSCIEYMFILSKGEPKTFNPVKRVNLQKAMNKLVTNRNVDGSLTSRRYTNTEESPLYNAWYYSGGFMKTTTDVFAYDHPAMFPEDLAEDHIDSWSNEGDLVYDCFMGSGTTAKSAIKLRRNFIGSEISNEYCDIANKRIKQELSQLKLAI